MNAFVQDPTIVRDLVNVRLLDESLNQVGELSFEFQCVATATVTVNSSQDVVLEVGFYDDRRDIEVYLGDSNHGIATGLATVTTAVARETARLQALEEIEDRVRAAYSDGKGEGFAQGRQVEGDYYRQLMPLQRQSAYEKGVKIGALAMFPVAFRAGRYSWLPWSSAIIEAIIEIPPL